MKLDAENRKILKELIEEVGNDNFDELFNRLADKGYYDEMDGTGSMDMGNIYQFCLEVVPNLIDLMSYIPPFAYHDMQIGSNFCIPKNIEYICNNAFDNSSIVNLILPENLKTLSPYALANMKIQKIYIPDGCEIDYDVFAGCSELKTISVGHKTIQIGPMEIADWGLGDLRSADLTSKNKRVYSMKSGTDIIVRK